MCEVLNKKPGAILSPAELKEIVDLHLSIFDQLTIYGTVVQCIIYLALKDISWTPVEWF